MKRALISAVGLVAAVLLALPASAQVLQKRTVTVQPAPSAVRAPAAQIRTPVQVPGNQQMQVKDLQILGSSLMKSLKLVKSVYKVDPALWTKIGCRSLYLRHSPGDGMDENVKCQNDLASAGKQGYLCEFLLENGKALYEKSEACKNDSTPTAYATERLYGCIYNDNNGANQLPNIERCLEGFEETTDGTFGGKVADTDVLMALCADGCDQSEIFANLSTILKVGYMCKKSAPIGEVCLLGATQLGDTYGVMGSTIPLWEHYCCAH